MSHFAPLARQASLECRLLRMTYTSRGCKHSERTIEVYLANDGYIDAVCRKAEDFRPYLDVVFEAFGVDRLMFGSDWPVCLLAGSYAQVFTLVNDYLAPLDAAARAQVLGGNAARFYGVK